MTLKKNLANSLPRFNSVQPQSNLPATAPLVQAIPEQRVKTKPRNSNKKRSDSAESSSGVNPNVPKLDKNIDTSGIAALYGQFIPKNHAEKILIFSEYLIKNLGIEDPNTDQVYTLYKKANERAPKAFAQAFHDAASKHGFIDFNGPTGTIKLSIVGENHFSHDLKRKALE
jgi:hypothetical protein